MNCDIRVDLAGHPDDEGVTFIDVHRRPWKHSVDSGNGHRSIVYGHIRGHHRPIQVVGSGFMAIMIVFG